MEQEIQPQPQQLNPIPPNNKNKIIVAVVSLLIIVLLTIVGYFIFSKRSAKPVETQTQQSVQKVEISDWKTYQSAELGFEAKYPSTWVANTGTDNITGKIVSVSLDGAYQAGDTKTPSASVTFFIQRNQNPNKLSVKEWYDNELKKIKSLPPDYSSIETTIAGEPAILRSVSGTFGKHFDLFTSVNGTDILTISYISQDEFNSTYLQILSSVKLNINHFGIVSFVKDDTSSWPLEWHITLSPEDTKNNEFQIVSQLKTTKPTGIESTLGFDENILSDVLVAKREIQPKIGDPVDIKFRLANDSHVNPNGPRGYQYSDMAAGFSRLGGGYGTSFPIYLLGNKVVDRSFAETGNFVGSKILIATVKTSDEKGSYTYEIFLEKLPIK